MFVLPKKLKELALVDSAG